MTENPFFDSINSILDTKKYWMVDDDKQKEYNALGVNIAMSQHIDAILFANELNFRFRSLSKKMHYDYLFYSIRKMKRNFQKWAKKPVKDEDIDLVMQYYKVNKQKAEDYLAILTEENLETIQQNMEKGTC